MVFAGAFLVIAVIHAIVTFIVFVVTLILKILARTKKDRRLKIAGNVFLVIWIVFVSPFVALIGYSGFHAVFAEVTLPDGETTKYVSRGDVSRMESYINDPDEEPLRALEELLDQKSDLVFYRDVNREGILDEGIKTANAEIVRIALEHGAVFDDPVRFRRRSYEKGSMDDLIGQWRVRSVSEGDVEILKMMFERNATTEIKTQMDCYSTAFGEAVWAILYNDEAVTDLELELIQIFIDHNAASDGKLIVWEDVPSNYGVDSDKVARDKNYRRLIDLIGRTHYRTS
ncbi:MAG: hypothetical protein NC084_07170 [Bacteroides sp.]|nr:hypothetical protein [Eubacterium sp.]MCM1418378.1 hypothetical protein [Roseburia sp.]MCM1462479.1 hypothetical protein [Bacteroides sp.]